MTNDFPQVLTIEETSTYLRIPLSTLYKLAQNDKIPCQKVGRHWRFRKETIDQWLDKRSVVPNKPEADQTQETKQ